MKKLLLVFMVLVAFGTSAVFAGGAQEETDELWPRTQPVVTVGFGAGGGTDTSVRPVIAKMEEYLGETINVVNMEGAASAVAANHVLNLPADGYNMFATGSGPFAGFRVMGTADTDWGDWVSWHPFVGPAAMLVRPDSHLQTFDEIMEAISNDEVDFGISGFGVGPHVLAEAIFDIAGVPSPNYVTYGSCRDSSVGCIAGDVDVTMATFSAAVDFVKAGDLKAIAVTTPETYQVNGIEIDSITDVLPGSEDVPMLSETWPFMMRRGAPDHIVEELTEAFIWAMEQPDIIEYAESQALNVAGYYGEDADEFLSFSEAGYSWALWNSGLAENDPDDYDIPTTADWDWNVERQKIY